MTDALVERIAAAIRADIIDPEICADDEEFCFRSHIHEGMTVDDKVLAVYASPERVAEIALDALRNGDIIYVWQDPRTGMNQNLSPYDVSIVVPWELPGEPS